MEWRYNHRDKEVFDLLVQSYTISQILLYYLLFPYLFYLNLHQYLFLSNLVRLIYAIPRLNYEKFSTSTGPILADVIANRRSYLRSYAFSNMHEFWAVSVEAFFENPEGLKENMPDLYEALSHVLNQNPITKTKLLKSEL